MRVLLRHLPLLLTLLIPLGLLAWLGSQELSRLEARARSILQDEAHRFLRNEESKVRSEIDAQARGWLWEPGQDGLTARLARSDTTLVQVQQELSKTTAILDVFLTDPNFELVAPRAPTAKVPSAPLNKLPLAYDNERRDLALADMLMNMGDTDGAIQSLGSYVGEEDDENFTANANPGTAWARFRLGGLFDKMGRGSDADNNYFAALSLAEDVFHEQPSEDMAFVRLFSTILRAEVLLDPETILAILQGICAGSREFRYTDDLAEDVLDYAVYQHLAAFFPAGSEHRPPYDRAVETYHVRKLSREFAREYEAHGRWRLRVENNPSLVGSQRVIYHVLTTERGSSLLALRPVSPKVASRYAGASWIGIRLDLSALVSSSLSANPTSVPGNVALAVQDPSGVPLLANTPPPTEDLDITFAPVVSTLGNLRFLAVPLTNPAEIQSTERNQLILALILVVVALGGAFMLIRSVQHQTQLAQMKVQLLSRVTHELKTPLAVIKMYGETLGLGRARNEEQVSKFAGIISAESDRLTKMVERILDFSKMEAGTFTYEKQRIDLGELVEYIKDEYLPHVESQGKDLTGEVATGLMVDVDPEAMAGAIVNLLENAVKYTPGTERSDLAVELHSRNGAAVLEVKDRGVGIPKSERSRIFDDFYRATNAGEIRGAGIGLSLVDNFARSHGGRIEALGREGGGTTMRLTLPLAPKAPPPQRS